MSNGSFLPCHDFLELDVDDRDYQQEADCNRAHRRGEIELQGAKGQVINYCAHNLRAVERATTGQEVDHRKGLKGPDQVQENDDHKDRFQTGQSYMEEPGDRPGAVHLGRFIERLGNGLHRGKRDDGIKGEFPPNLCQHDRGKGGVGMAGPGPAVRAFDAQHVGQKVI